MCTYVQHQACPVTGNPRRAETNHKTQKAFVARLMVREHQDVDLTLSRDCFLLQSSGSLNKQLDSKDIGRAALEASVIAPLPEG